MWDRVARVLVRRPVLVLSVAFLITATLSVGLLNLEFRTDQNTLVNSSSQVFKDNVRYQQKFGGDNMLILVSGDPVDLFSRTNIGALEQMEKDLRATPGVSTVVGPYTAMQFAKAQLTVAPELLMKGAARADDTETYNGRVDTEQGNRRRPPPSPAMPPPRGRAAVGSRAPATHPRHLLCDAHRRTR